MKGLRLKVKQRGGYNKWSYFTSGQALVAATFDRWSN